MIAKVKAQKTRLSNYLVKELGAKLTKSQTTESDYFQIGTVQIRISDHTFRRTDKYINIFIPFNDPNSFIIENNYTISILKSLKEVKAFLHSLLFIQKVCGEVLNQDIQKKLIKEQEKNDDLLKENILLKDRIKELESMVDTRNKAITGLAARAKAAEELALGDPTTVVTKKAVILGRSNIYEDVVSVDGTIYPLSKFPVTFKTKIRNIINNSNSINPI